MFRWVSRVVSIRRFEFESRFFKKLAIPALFVIYFRLFKQILQFLQQKIEQVELPTILRT